MREPLCVSLQIVKSAHPARKEMIMLFTIAIVLLVLWALGLVSGYALGGLIHLLLVVALIVVVLQFLSGRRTV